MKKALLLLTPSYDFMFKWILSTLTVKEIKFGTNFFIALLKPVSFSHFHLLF